MEWNMLLPMLCRYCKDAPRWTNQMWIEHLHERKQHEQIELLLELYRLHSLHACTQGHDGENTLDFSLLDKV